MALTVYTNTYATTVQGHLATANTALTKSIERLSSGLRINHAADDASGLAISERLRSQIRAMSRASLNAQDGISMLQVAEGGMEVLNEALQRLRELAVQAGNGTYSANDRMSIQKEVDQLKLEIDHIAASTEFNTIKLLNGSSAGIWSANSDQITAIFRGPVESANYRVTIDADGTGRNSICKSNIFALNKDLVQAIDSASPALVDFTAKGDIKMLNGSQLVYSTFNSVVAPTSSGVFVSATSTAAYDFSMNTYKNYFMAVSSLKTAVGPSSDNNIDSVFVSSGALTVTFNNGATNINITAQLTSDADFSAVPAITGVEFKFVDAATNVTSTVTVSLDLEVYSVNSASATFPPIASEFRYYYGANVNVGGNTIHFKLPIGSQFDGELLGSLGDIDVGLGDTMSFDVYPPLVVSADIEAEQKLLTSYQKVSSSSTYRLASASITAAFSNYFENSLVSGMYNHGIASSMLDSANVLNKSGYIEVEFLNTVSGFNKDTSLAPYTSEADYDAVSRETIANVKFTFVDVATGERVTKTVSLDMTAYTVSQADTVSAVGTSFIYHQYVELDADTKFNFYLPIAGDGVHTADTISAGDKMLFMNQTAFVAAGASDSDARVTLRVPTDHDGNSATKTVLVDGPTIRIENGLITGGTIAGATIESGYFYDASLSWVVNPLYVDMLKESDVVNPFVTGIEVYLKGEVAPPSAKLKDIATFTNIDGRMILENTQTLTIYGNHNRMTEIYLEGNNTVGDLVNKLQKALVELGLGADTVRAEELVRYVTEANKQKTGINTVPGTLIVQAAKAGPASDLKFIANDELLNALGITELQSSRESYIVVSVYDAHTDELIGTDKVSDYVVRGIIKGVDIAVDPNFGLEAYYDSSLGQMTYKPMASISTYLHIVDKSRYVHVGSAEKQIFGITIPQCDTLALGIQDVYVTSVGEAQKAVTKLDYAIERMVNMRATLGAQVNRLEFTMQNLSTTRQNLIMAESRIRDLDIAEESAIFASKQILVNAGVAMLAQANTLPQVALQLIQGR
ncbi:flagellin [Deferribacterales bacterium RsTz2092]|nr:hypothetical protein AGMMS49941_04510 [Deferribacterales bacterium]